jgi:hypothetical protein
MTILNAEMKEIPGETTKKKKEGIPWYEQLSTSELLKMHITRAFTLDPEVMLFHRPVDEMEADHAARILDMLRQHVDGKGLFKSPQLKQISRPRTVFFSSGEDRERADSAADVSDVVWHVSPKGFRVAAGGHTTGVQKEKGDNKILHSWSTEVRNLQGNLDKEKEKHVSTQAELENHKTNLESLKSENETMRGALNDVTSQAKRALRDARHYETELAAWEQEEQQQGLGSILSCGSSRHAPPAPKALSRTLADMVSVSETRKDKGPGSGGQRPPGYSGLAQSPNGSPRVPE